MAIAHPGDFRASLPTTRFCIASETTATWVAASARRSLRRHLTAAFTTRQLVTRLAEAGLASLPPRRRWLRGEQGVYQAHAIRLNGN